MLSSPRTATGVRSSIPKARSRSRTFVPEASRIPDGTAEIGLGRLRGSRSCPLDEQRVASQNGSSVNVYYRSRRSRPRSSTTRSSDCLRRMAIRPATKRSKRIVPAAREPAKPRRAHHGPWRAAPRRDKSRRMERRDVVIVGSGPAGAAAALRLAAGDPVRPAGPVLLEKAHHPRDKTCAGGLIPKALRLLEELGVPLAVPHARVDGAAIAVPGRRVPERRVRVPGSDLCRVVRRRELDAALAWAARDRGVDLREGERV